jgi:hypothetical protein
MRNSNITKNRIRVALLLVLAASIIGLAPAFSASARAFSINDVSGAYVDHASVWEFGNGAVNFSPTSLVGLVTFTPATGTFHEDLIIRGAAGTNRHLIFNGTYTVDANGHGTMTWLSGSGNTKHIDFYIVNGGAELKYIVTDPPATDQIASTFGTLTKQ